MMKVKYYKCPVCNRKFKKLSGFGEHVKTTHPEEIPKEIMKLRSLIQIRDIASRTMDGINYAFGVEE